MIWVILFEMLNSDHAALILCRGAPGGPLSPKEYCDGGSMKEKASPLLT